jgi:cephalosporin-C deacetylase
MLTDLSEAELWAYRSVAEEPDDFDEFWARTLADATRHDLDVSMAPVATRLTTVDVFDVRFAGYGGHPIAAWLILPRGVATGTPGVVQFAGYGGGRGAPHEHLLWSAAGYAHLVMDTRGQGSGHRAGATGDPIGPSGPSASGMLTKGIQSPDDYYYRRLFIDAVRAVDVLAGVGVVDSSRIATLGASQGGAMALAAAALRSDVAATLAYSPFLCDVRRASLITDSPPYKELSTYLAAHRTAPDRVFETLSYFDGVNLAKRIRNPTWMSAALMDAVCPPSTAFGAFHNLAGPRHMTVWPYNGHEGGGPEDEALGIAALGEALAG